MARQRKVNPTNDLVIECRVWLPNEPYTDFNVVAKKLPDKRICTLMTVKQQLVKAMQEKFGQRVAIKL